MKPCKGFEERITDYAEGLLPQTYSKELEAHFQTCSSCRETFNAIRSLRIQLKHLRPVKTSADFNTVLHARIRMERSLNRRSLLLRPAALPAYAATGALALVAAFFLFNPGERRTRMVNTPARVQLSAETAQANGLTASAQGVPANGAVKFPMDWSIVKFFDTPRELRSDGRRVARPQADHIDSLQTGRIREVKAHRLEF